MIERGSWGPASPEPSIGLEPTVLAALLILVGLLGQLQLELVDGVILADLALGALIAWWFVAVRNDLGRRLGWALVPPLTLILVGTLVAMTHVGAASWAVRDLVLDVGAVLGFFAVAGATALADRRQWRWIRRLLTVSLAVVVVQLVADRGGDLRSSAGFPNPNLAAHFIVTVTAVGIYLQRERNHKLAVGVLGAVGWLATGSFGALIQAGVMVGYRLAVKARAAHLAVLGAALTCVVAAVSWIVLSGVVGTVTVAGLSTDRLGRSSDGRFQKWVDGLNVFGRHPTGVGPGSVEALGLSDNELHNEPLAYLVERGPFAIVGLALFYLVLWTLSRPGGPVRMLVLGFAVASLFRETSHYRHLWLGLALLLAWERYVDPVDRSSRVVHPRSNRSSRSGRSSRSSGSMAVTA